MLEPSLEMTSAVPANIRRFSGFADCYDAHRPTPPLVLVDVLTQLAEAPRPRLVVDLGSGTGLSTRLWNGRADAIVGIEPNPDMRRRAEARSGGMPTVSYRDGASSRTGLSDGGADIVTCSQALHWMPPEATFAEVARILRPGGVFAAYDVDWPPTVHREVDAAYLALESRVKELEAATGCSRAVTRWEKHEHLGRIQDSGRFRMTKEIVLHSVEHGDANRLVGLALSQGGVEALMQHGLSEDEIGLTELRRIAVHHLGSRAQPWYFSYRVRLGLK